MNIQTVLTKNAGHTIPEELIQLILARKPTAFGFAVQCVDDNGNPELSVTQEEGTPDMADIKEFLRNAQDFKAMVIFGELGDKPNAEDIMPFILNDADDRPFIAIGIEGDFPQYADPKSGHTDEYNFATQIILPTIADICEYADGDIEKIVAKLGQPLFNNQFLGATAHRGVLSILPLEGDILSFSKNELGETYDWGTTSNRHTYGDAKQEINTEAANDKPVKKKFSFGGKKETPPPIPQDVATKGDAPRASVPKVEKKETPKSALPIKVPEWVHSNDDKRSWYQMVAGGIPKEWKRRIPIIPVDGVTPPNNLEELNAWRASKFKKAMVQEAPKTETSAGAPKSGAEVKAIRAEESLPILSAKDTEALLDFVTKHLDGQSVEMMKPSEIQAIEKKFPPLSEALGIKPHEMLNWPIAGLLALGQHNAKAIVLGFLEMRNLWRNTLKAEDLVGTSKPTSTTKETKIGDAGTKVESVSNEPAPKKKMFNFGKKAA